MPLYSVTAVGMENLIYLSILSYLSFPGVLQTRVRSCHFSPYTLKGFPSPSELKPKIKPHLTAMPSMTSLNYHTESVSHALSIPATVFSNPYSSLCFVPPGLQWSTPQDTQRTCCWEILISISLFLIQISLLFSHPTVGRPSQARECIE